MGQVEGVNHLGNGKAPVPLPLSQFDKKFPHQGTVKPPGKGTAQDGIKGSVHLYQGLVAQAVVMLQMDGLADLVFPLYRKPIRLEGKYIKQNPFNHD
jgi:hypothetical protein